MEKTNIQSSLSIKFRANSRRAPIKQPTSIKRLIYSQIPEGGLDCVFIKTLNTSMLYLFRNSAAYDYLPYYGALTEQSSFNSMTYTLRETL